MKYVITSYYVPRFNKNIQSGLPYYMTRDDVDERGFRWQLERRRATQFEDWEAASVMTWLIPVEGWRRQIEPVGIEGGGPEDDPYDARDQRIRDRAG